MSKPIPWPKVAAVAFSATLMVGYVVFRTAYAQEGGADSRVLPSSKSGRVVPQQQAQQQAQQQRAQSPYAQPYPEGVATTTSSVTLTRDAQLELQQAQPSRPFQLGATPTTQITIQTSSPAMLPSSKSAAVIRPGDATVIFNLVPPAVSQPGTSPPTSQPATTSPAPSTQFFLEPQQRQRR